MTKVNSEKGDNRETLATISDVSEGLEIIRITIDLSDFRPVLCKGYRCRSTVGFFDGSMLVVDCGHEGSLGIPSGQPRRWIDQTILIGGLEQSCLDKLAKRRGNAGLVDGQYPVSGWVLNGRGVKIVCDVCQKVRRFSGTRYLTDDGALFGFMSH